MEYPLINDLAVRLSLIVQLTLSIKGGSDPNHNSERIVSDHRITV